MEPNHVLCSANEMADSLAKKEYLIRFPFVISCSSWFDAIFVFVVLFYFCLVCSLFLFALGTVLLYPALLCLAFSSLVLFVILGIITIYQSKKEC